MQSQPADGEEPRPAWQRIDATDHVQPLSAYVSGTLTMQFAGGAVTRLATSQFDARSILAKQREVENSDKVTWHMREWFAWDDASVVATSFEADKDQNWDLSPYDRSRLGKAGFKHGVVTHLIRYWRDHGPGREPSYSARAIVLLHHMALDGADRPLWEAAAVLLEGSAGAQKAARDWRLRERPLADDDAPPEETAGTPDTNSEEGDQSTGGGDGSSLGEDDSEPGGATPNRH